MKSCASVSIRSMSATPKIVLASLRRALLMTSFAAVTVFGTGCESSTASADGSSDGSTAATGSSGRDRYKVAVERAPFYKLGPAQGYGPDVNLTQGTIVRMIERKYGYSQVGTTYGDGWMATSDLEPAPPEEPEPYTFAEASWEGPTSSGRAENFDEPVNVLPEDLVLPEPEPLPEPSEPHPTFRY